MYGDADVIPPFVCCAFWPPLHLSSHLSHRLSLEHSPLLLFTSPSPPHSGAVYQFNQPVLGEEVGGREGGREGSRDLHPSFCIHLFCQLQTSACEMGCAFPCQLVQMVFISTKQPHGTRRHRKRHCLYSKMHSSGKMYTARHRAL